MKKSILLTSVAAAALMVGTQLAHANAEMQVYIGSTLEYDSGVLTGNIGGVTPFTATTPLSVAGWTINDSTGNWSSLTGLSYLDLNTFSIIETGASSAPLTIIFSDNNNLPPGGTATTKTDDDLVTGNLAGTFTTYWSPGNTLLATNTPATQLSILAVPGSAVATASISAGAPYTDTEVLKIVSGSGVLNTGDSLTTVPDGGTTMMLLGGAFCAIGALRRKLTK